MKKKKNNFKWIPVMLPFCVLISCGSVKKTERLNEVSTETLDTFQRVERLKAHVEKQEERLSKDETERRSTEIVTALFGTVDSVPVLKEFRIERTIVDRDTRTDKETEHRTVRTEAKNEEQQAEAFREASL